MKEIIIKKISLLNFKGARELSIDFDKNLTNIYGRNGSGKTTVFDAFTWLLFGKDSQDRKKFDLKTLNNDGGIIPQIPHEVSAVITVNGEEVRLTRRFTEKWVKRAGQTELVFTGNEEERFYNDVPCSQREYETKIADICHETVFKFITSPTYFTAQSADAQKSMLLKMAGSISDSEIATGNEDFERLLETITGKTLADFKREIASKKSHINVELVDLPGRIDEKKRDITKAEDEAEDWAVLEAELTQKREARADIEKQFEDVVAQQRAEDGKRAEISRNLSQLKGQQQKRISDVTLEVQKSYYEAMHRQNTLQARYDEAKHIIVSNQRSIAQLLEEVRRCEDRRNNVLIVEFETLQAQRTAIMGEQLQIDEAQFVCPTCHRPLDVADIEEKEAEILQNFEKEREKRLARIAEELERNNREGIANNDRKAHYRECIAKNERVIEENQAVIAEVEQNPDFTMTLTKPDASAALAADETLKQIVIDIAKTEEELNAQSKVKNDTADELREARTMLTEAIEELIAKLAKRTDVDADRRRLSDLEEQMQKLNVELAELEKQEFIIAEFSKARNAAIEARINGLFSIVRFRWIAPQINGAEKETCEATLNGKPYSTCSNAEKTLIGLDIINAICKSQGIYAPIFVDNAESMNDIAPMKSQVIRLIVSRDDKLIIESGSAQNNLFQ